MVTRPEIHRIFQKILNIFPEVGLRRQFVPWYLSGWNTVWTQRELSPLLFRMQASTSSMTFVFGTEKSKIVSRTRGLRNHSVFPNLFRSNSIPGLQGYWISLRNLQHEIHNPCILGTTRPNTFCANLKRNSSAHAYLSFAAPSCLSPSQQRSAGTLLVWSRKLSKQ